MTPTTVPDEVHGTGVRLCRLVPNSRFKAPSWLCGVGEGSVHPLPEQQVLLEAAPPRAGWKHRGLRHLDGGESGRDQA